MQMNHRRAQKGQIHQLSASSKEEGDIRKPKSKDKRQHHFESFVHPALASRGFASHVFLVIVQMYKKALTHEHPSGESADEVKGEGVGFFFNN